MARRSNCRRRTCFWLLSHSTRRSCPNRAARADPEDQRCRVGGVDSAGHLNRCTTASAQQSPAVLLLDDAP